MHIFTMHTLKRIYFIFRICKVYLQWILYYKNKIIFSCQEKGLRTSYRIRKYLETVCFMLCQFNYAFSSHPLVQISCYFRFSVFRYICRKYSEADLERNRTIISSWRWTSFRCACWTKWKLTLGGRMPPLNNIRPFASFVRNLKEIFPDFLAFHGGRICNKSQW